MHGRGAALPIAVAADIKWTPECEKQQNGGREKEREQMKKCEIFERDIRSSRNLLLARH